MEEYSEDTLNLYIMIKKQWKKHKNNRTKIYQRRRIDEIFNLGKKIEN